MIDQTYAKWKRLAAECVGAGGITVGRGLTIRPDLLNVVLDHVGLSDTLRSEAEPNGPSNVVEFGSNETKGGFHFLTRPGPPIDRRNLFSSMGPALSTVRFGRYRHEKTPRALIL